MIKTFQVLLQVLFLAIAFGISVDCFNVTQLASGLGMRYTNPIHWDDIQNDCCLATGITCDLRGPELRIVGIEWFSMGLNGFINGSVITFPLETFDLHDNSLFGDFPKDLPSTLTSIDFERNNLNGSLPELPPNLQRLYLGSNFLSGPFPFIPDSLTELYIPGAYPVPGNQFTGTLLLYRPTYVFIIFNLISDIIIFDTSMLAYNFCDLSGNPLLGSPNIANLTMCYQNSLFYPVFSSTSDFTMQETSTIPTSTPSYSEYTDCAKLIQFAADLGMMTKKPSIWAQLQNDCCSAAGVTCIDGIPIVTGINWSGIGLNGYINQTAIPEQIQNLNLNTNLLKGPFPISLPYSLITLDFGGNELTGSLPPLPPNLQTLILYRNKMTGPVPTLPNSLTTLWLHNMYPAGNGNKFTGTVTINTPISLFLHFNMITDIVISNTSLLTFSTCDLSNNPLIGNLRLVNLTMCQRFDLFHLPISTSFTRLPTSTIAATISSSTYYPSTPETDCNKIINLALGLKMNLQQPYLFSQIQSDCCSAGTIACDANDNVMQIYWNSLSLNGVINGSAIPTGIIYLDLSNNRINGGIPTALPLGLENLHLNNNQLNGVLPTLPAGLRSLHLGGNYISGNIPSLLPNTLTYLDLSTNRLNGVIPTLPNVLMWLFLHDNQINGTIPSNLPPNLLALSLYRNKMTGTVPTLPSSLIWLYLGSPMYDISQFSGNVSLNKPTKLMLNHNNITSLVIADTSQLIECDISYNPLLNSPNIANLTMCMKNNLYSPISSKASQTKSYPCIMTTQNG